MPMTTAALRREDHLCVSAGGRERPRRPLALPMEIDSFEAPSLAISVLAAIVPPAESAGDTCTHCATPFGPVYSDPACFLAGERRSELIARIYRIETIPFLTVSTSVGRRQR